MFGFGKKSAAPRQDVTVTPVTLDNNHSVVQNYGNYPAKNTQNAWAATYSPELPPVPQQDRILVHWYRPGDSDPPERFWADANEDKISRGTQEKFTTTGWQESIDPVFAAQNPWHTDIRSLLRPTAEQSPSIYRFVRPFYPGDGYGQSTGRHFSMASNRRAYPVGGMAAQSRTRNTFRLEPVARDAENMDLSGTAVAAADAAVYVSPASQPRQWGL